MAIPALKCSLALDEIETRKGWVPLIGTVTGVPGDPSIKATGKEGELYRKGPDKKKVAYQCRHWSCRWRGERISRRRRQRRSYWRRGRRWLGDGSGFLFKGSDMKLDKGTQLEVRLDRDLVVPTH